MITAVLDANTLVSAILVPQGIPAELLRAAYNRDFACVSSAAIVAEVLRTLGRPRVRRKYHVPPHDLLRLKRFLESDLIAVPITVPVQGVATHPEDDLILATAVSAQADYLVTGDRQLLKLGSYRGVTIVSPRGFLELLSTSGPEAP